VGQAAYLRLCHYVDEAGQESNSVKPEERSIRILRINQEVLLRTTVGASPARIRVPAPGRNLQRRRSRQGIGDVGDGQAGSGARARWA